MTSSARDGSTRGQDGVTRHPPWLSNYLKDGWPPAAKPYTRPCELGRVAAHRLWFSVILGAQATTERGTPVTAATVRVADRGWRRCTSVAGSGRRCARTAERSCSRLACTNCSVIRRCEELSLARNRPPAPVPFTARRYPFWRMVGKSPGHRLEQTARTVSVTADPH